LEELFEVWLSVISELGSGQTGEALVALSKWLYH
jgi:hypothetical protein